MSENLLVYVGGTPGCATMHLAAFLHLNDECFCFNTEGGPLASLRDRHSGNNFLGAAFQLSVGGNKSDQNNMYHTVLKEKNETWKTKEVFSKRIIGIRDDTAIQKFLANKKHGGFEGRRLLLIYPVRRNMEELYWTWTKGIHAQGDPILKRTGVFKDRIADHFAKAL